MALVLGDVDGDGDADLIVGNANFAGEPNRLYLNDGSGTMIDASGQLPSVVDITHALALGDVDGDLDLDLIVGNHGALSSGAQNRLYLNDGAGMFVDATPQLPGSNDITRDLGLGDLDGDRDLDLVVANAGADRLLLNDGAGIFADVSQPRLPAASQRLTFAVALADVDADGDLDLAFGDANIFMPQTNRLYLNDGAGTFTDASAQLPADADYTVALVFGDVDGDGDPDLVCGNDRFERNRPYLNDGLGLFTDAAAAGCRPTLSLPQR
ncbi:MAG: VCBS repeat-containing protein [Planctomycetota bacterium]